jgi:dTDP-4-amino-4,6-dideoxygalactose transaminase
MLEWVPELTLPYEPAYAAHTYYLYTLLLPEDWAGKKRDRVVEILRKKYGVGCIIANPPVYTDNEFIRSRTGRQRCPKSEAIAARFFCPSLHPLMTDGQNEYIAAAVIETVEKVRKG